MWLQSEAWHAGVRRPTAMPRVSEYVPEIVAYISTIIQKGLAYEANSSVYFDTCAFECVFLCSLEPIAVVLAIQRSWHQTVACLQQEI